MFTACCDRFVLIRQLQKRDMDLNRSAHWFIVSLKIMAIIHREEHLYISKRFFTEILGFSPSIGTTSETSECQEVLSTSIVGIKV